ncbi:YSIRK signal domain/LPXTG anchor domain surface protein [Staphylococcus petrasii]|uniref:MucBP domain-containing protein n=1 Tax=Staphylococcus petrasii TaxID=1276936 RepID=UPI000CD03140|nr:MucBP domain-containing protein [Staphylococcus petrasii]PNZ84951.1 YSIRK signal domain/LPXTG anchor domain surface protein [Staphylococcus petrasii]
MNRNNNKNRHFQPNIQNKYSIRKFSVGIASILVGSFLVFGVNNEAHAAEVKGDIKASDKQNKEEQNQTSSTNLTSPQVQPNQNDNLKKTNSEDNTSNNPNVENIETNNNLKAVPSQTNEQKDTDNNNHSLTNNNTQKVDNAQQVTQKDVDNGTNVSQNKKSVSENSHDNVDNLLNNNTSSKPVKTTSPVIKKRTKRDVSDDSLAGDFVFSGTSSHDKNYNISSDLINNRREMNTSFSFTGSGHGAINDGKLVYEAPKKFIISAPTFSNSEYVTRKTDLSDTDTWRYQFDLRPIAGTSAGQININQIVGGMIWTGPGEGDVVTTTMKMYQGDNLVATKQTNATFDHVKGGIYVDRGQTPPNSIWKLAPKPPANTTPTIGMLKEDGTVSDKSDNYRYQVPLPSDKWFLENRDDAITPRYYSRYTDFTYNIQNVPSWLELDPEAKSNQFWTQDASGIHMHLNEGQILPYMGYYPVLKLKKDALTPDVLQQFKDNGFIKTNMNWQTVGRLPNGQDYIQNVPDPEGIKFRMINEAGKATSDVYFNTLRTLDASRLFTKSDHTHEQFRITKMVNNRDQSNKYVPTYMHSIQMPTGQDGDYFTTFTLPPEKINYNNGSANKDGSKGIALKSPFVLYGVNSDGSTTKLAQWTELNNSNKTYHFGKNKYSHLVLQTPIIRDTVSPDSEVLKEIYGWSADVTYAVDDHRWDTAAKDDNVQRMQNGLIVDQVPQNSLPTASSVPTRSLSGHLLNGNYSYIHTKEAFPHTLTQTVVRNTNASSGNLLNYNDKANVVIKANTKEYMKYLSEEASNNTSDIVNDKLDNIKNVYLSLSVPDGTALGNARLWSNNELIRTSNGWTDGYYETTSTNILKKRPVIEPVKVVTNYKNSGRTLYIYKAPEGYDWNKSEKNAITSRSSLSQDTAEMTFDIYNRGTLPVGTYSIRYATIWDKNSEMVRPTTAQSLDNNQLELSDVITEDLSANEKYVSVIDIPFKIALAKEFASTLTIGKTSSNSFDKSQVDVNLGDSVNLQTSTVNFTNSDGVLKEIVVTIPKDNVKTNLTALVPDTDKYRVVYTTDSDVQNGTYTSNPTDLTKVTAVKYVFDTPLVLKKGDNFQTNVRVTVPEDAPILTKSHSQIFTRGVDNSWLAGNKVELETEDNRGTLVVNYTDENGNVIQSPITSQGPKNTEYNASVPQLINNQNRHYKFIRVDNQFEPILGQYIKAETKTVHLIYTEVFEGNVIADFKTADGEVLSPQVTVANREIEGTNYTATAATIPNRVSYEENENGRVKKTISYRLVATPENESGTVVGKQTIEVHYVYEPVVTYEQVPNDPPQVEIPVLEVTRYVDTEGNELKDTEEGTLPPPGIIGDKWQYTKRMTQEDGITTYVYERIQTEIPNDPPQVEIPVLEVTRYVDTEGNELKDTEEGTLPPPGIIGDKWQYTKQMTQENGITTYVYERIQTEIPNNPPQVEIPVLEVTRYVDTEGNELKDTEEGTLPPPGIIGDKWQYTKQMTQENGITTYVYERIQTEIPNDPPQVEIPVLEVTRYVDTEGNELKDTEEGTLPPPGIIGDKWQYTKQMTQEDGITTYVYERIQTEIPNDPPQVEIPVLEVTRYVDTEGNELKDTEEGTLPPLGIIGDKWQYTKQMTQEDGITTYVYERIQTEIPNDPPQVEIPVLEVTRYVDPEGNELKDTEEGTLPPPGIIGDRWQYTGKVTSEDGITTYVYERIQTEIPNDPPQVEIPVLEVTRYVDTEGNELKDTEEGTLPPPGVIGDKWQYTGKVTTEDGITTYVYERIQTEIPNNPPQVEIPVLEVTRYVDPEGNELKDTEEGTLPPPGIIGDKWQYTGKVTSEDGITTYVYDRIQTEIPNDPPQVEIPVLEVTRYVDPEGNELKDTEEGTLLPPSVIGDKWQYTGKVTTKDGITTYVYDRIQTEIPNDPPQVEIPILEVTSYVDIDGNEVKVPEEGTLPPPGIIGDKWQYTGKVTTKDGITTYVYEKIQTQIPNDPPQVEIPELEITTYIDTDGNVVKDPEKGIVPPQGIIGDKWQYTGKVVTKDGITTYVYEKIQSKIPNNPPQVEIPELKITTYIDTDENVVKDPEKGIVPPPSVIGDKWQYTGKVITKDGITTYVYEKIQSKIPNHAPQVDIPELQITRYIDKNGHEITTVEKGKKPPYLLIDGGWRYTGIVIENNGITTYVYEKVKDKTSHEPKKVHTFTKEKEKQPLKPHTTQKPKTALSTEVKPHKVELPKTGETNTNPSALASILLAIGSLFVFRRKKEDVKKNQH